MAATKATVTPITKRTRPGGRGEQQTVTVGESVAAFLAGPRANESANTQRAYSGALRRFGDELGLDRPLDAVAVAEIGDALAALWTGAAPATWNQRRAAVGSWLGWCAGKKHWTAPQLPADAERRRENVDTTKAVDAATVETICTRRGIPLRERLLWRMLYETASRADAVLQLDVEDLDLENKRARVTVKGGNTEWIVWGRGTAMLLPRYLKGRATGPLFLSDRRPGPRRRASHDARDIDPGTGLLRLGYDRARALIKEHTGLTLHQLRHSAATHLGEAGVDVTVIMAKTHHRSIRTVARYARPGLVAVESATEQLSAPRRRQ